MPRKKYTHTAHGNKLRKYWRTGGGKQKAALKRAEVKKQMKWK